MRKKSRNMTTIDGIPVYRVLVDDENDGMVRISLVDDPAVMSDFQAFARQKVAQLFAVQDEDKRLVRGVVARADFPILRRNERLGDHYIIFPASSIREMAEKYLTEGRADLVDIMHDREDRKGIHLVQWFIKDTAAGVNPAGFDEIADGSLFAEYKVDDDETWAAIKDGTFKGFSMEVFYTLTPEENLGYVQEAVEDADGMFSRIIAELSSKDMSIDKRINLLRKLATRFLSSFGAVTTDKGVLAWDGDEDLKAGDSVYIEDAEGERAPAADGDYRTEDGKIIAVADGKVSEIRDPEAEVEPQKEPQEDADLHKESAEMSRHNRFREFFEESYEERTRKIIEALTAIGLEYPYIVEAGDTFAVVCVWSDEGEHYFRYELSFNEDGECVLGEMTEVKQEYVPVDKAEPAADPDPAPAVSIEEFEALKAENESLKQQVSQLSREPLAKHAHKSIDAAPLLPKTGNKRLDNLMRYTNKK